MNSSTSIKAHYPSSQHTADEIDATQFFSPEGSGHVYGRMTHLVTIEALPISRIRKLLIVGCLRHLHAQPWNFTLLNSCPCEFINEGFRIYALNSNVMVLGWDNPNQCGVENFVRDVVIPCLNGGPHISSFVQEVYRTPRLAFTGRSNCTSGWKPKAFKVVVTNNPDSGIDAGISTSSSHLCLFDLRASNHREQQRTEWMEK
ncbi:hypothetical protein K435DRAFT_809326 [Dendrothele bispora CBS 962.96]|uniref:Uncharacterized protein n=1 Tax=Dendrothele bispora (strain CBS 962.96) TaxID=1314807 RepID=A0A4S8KYL2_DENBC|nr:hypothetical protein K435DRAFT_809326 [Dendrothele bispora CBS 962.96]